MENRIARLEARINQLEKEVAELKKAAGLSGDKGKKAPMSGNEEALLSACESAGAASKRVKIGKLRDEMGWDAKEFDDALDALAKAGRILLHQGSMGLSLSNMDSMFMGDNGESFTEVSIP
ncbi:hypothetical protein SAMN02745216_01209 [Desulfatibacillum alkenivorans DSM 16219]|jgi:hypothetical protein|uniref:Uncharacterized protein n=1 Tax=Desulfatibacillum alkenivorans DSM 16219 TaxID=1121393 RepID=A0A1M6HF61_9BACT|nr:hypothetical protein [Desulfatibacillum alkenivorans]SHJ20816.1 hypothetical protein SAMN02745216_01209 [Desulfatibacillum alkenivorans DSM 16219]